MFHWFYLNFELIADFFLASKTWLWKTLSDIIAGLTASYSLFDLDCLVPCIRETAHTTQASRLDHLPLLCAAHPLSIMNKTEFKKFNMKSREHYILKTKSLIFWVFILVFSSFWVKLVNETLKYLSSQHILFLMQKSFWWQCIRLYPPSHLLESLSLPVSLWSELGSKQV